MVGAQQVCECSFVCDCSAARVPLLGSVRASGMLWCVRCAPGVEDDEPTLTEGPLFDGLLEEEPTREVVVDAGIFG